MGRITKFFIASEDNNYRPAVLSYKAFLIYAAILLLIRLLLLSQPAAGSAVESAALMALINSERSSRNLGTLIVNQSLLRASAEKSQDMLDRDYFAHIDPDGNYVWGRIVNAGYTPYKILGENLAVDFATSEGMVKAWIDSPTHRANLLNDAFADQGLTALYGDYQGRYTNVTASLFGTLFALTQKTPPASPPPPQPIPPPAIPPPPPPPPTPPTTSPTPAPPPPTPAAPAPTPTSIPTPTPAAPTQPTNNTSQSRLIWIKLIFTLFGLCLLGILAIDAIIIHRAQVQTGRSYSSYHFLTLSLIVIVTILIWWW